jgi:Tol biopolymer transport system component
MKFSRSLAAAACVVTASCGSDSPGISEPPDNHEQMVLETIQYDALGSSRLVFKRDEGDKRGIVLLDGSSRTGTITYSPLAGAWVAASPNSERLIYSGGTVNNQQRSYDIFVRDFDASTGTSLGGPGGMRDYPSWSPDGTRVVYAETAEKFSFHPTSIVSQTPVPGSARQVLWSATEHACQFARSPRQNAAGDVVFVYSWVFDFRFCVVNDDRIARATPGEPTFQILYGPGSTVFSPTWSPSGAEIAFFERGLSETGPIATIKRMSASGTNVRTITVRPHNGDGSWLAYSMCWPGDGSRIFFSLAQNSSDTHIYSVVVADGTVTQITTAPGVRDWSLSCN